MEFDADLVILEELVALGLRAAATDRTHVEHAVTKLDKRTSERNIQHTGKYRYLLPVFHELHERKNTTLKVAIINNGNLVKKIINEMCPFFTENTEKIRRKIL